VTHPVGEKRPNGFGLFDMHGNVWEWCWDWYSNAYYKESTAADDPRGPSGASDRVIRGGSWSDYARYCRSASRSRSAPADRRNYLGFRVARVPTPTPESFSSGYKPAKTTPQEGRAGINPPSSAPGDTPTGPKATPLAPIPSDPEYLTTAVGQTKLKRIPAGTFLMGSPDDDKDAKDYEKPQHRVRISKPFYLGVYEITQAQYQAVMGHNPSYFSPNGGGKDKIAGQSTDRHPVENVSWLDAVKFCNKLSEMEGLKPSYKINGETVQVLDWNGPGYRLPTEAEWEYACRANAPTPQRYSFGDNAGSLGESAWYSENSGSATHPVGEKQPNGFGLFDMHGNVWEWCWDWYSDAYYQEPAVDDPRGPSGAAARVIRGGCWRLVPGYCRSAIRYGIAPDYRNLDLGFRVARVQSGR
jgi:formylglycine-generating enzyme required for sulfatase activity